MNSQYLCSGFAILVLLLYWYWVGWGRSECAVRAPRPYSEFKTRTMAESGSPTDNSATLTTTFSTTFDTSHSQPSSGHNLLDVTRWRAMNFIMYWWTYSILVYIHIQGWAWKTWVASYNPATKAGGLTETISDRGTEDWTGKWVRGDAWAACWCTAWEEAGPAEAPVTNSYLWEGTQGEEERYPSTGINSMEFWVMGWHDWIRFSRRWRVT